MKNRTIMLNGEGKEIYVDSACVEIFEKAGYKIKKAQSRSKKSAEENKEIENV